MCLILGCLFALITIVALILFFTCAQEDKSVFGGGTIGCGFVSVLFLIVSACFTVDTGHSGVVTYFGKVTGQNLGEGFHLLNPLCDVTEMSVRTNTYTMSSINDEGDKKGDDGIVALSSNGLRMPMDVTVPYRLNPDAASWVLKNLGTNYVNGILSFPPRS